MNRPSRGLCPSATTIRYAGTFLVPTRRNLILTGTLLPPKWHFRHHALAGHGLLHLAHFFHHFLHRIELLQHVIYLSDFGSTATSDARSSPRIQILGAATFHGCHRLDDRL